jgi:hypothetical protein
MIFFYDLTIYMSTHQKFDNKVCNNDFIYGVWNHTLTYTKGSLVTYKDYTWVAINNSRGKYPMKFSEYWFQLCKQEKKIKTGNWVNSINYDNSDIVIYNGAIWICTLSNINKPPTISSIYWFFLTYTLPPNYKTIITLYNQLTDYSVALTDNIVQIQNDQNINVFLPQAITNEGQEIIISKISNNTYTITINAYSGDSINNGTDTSIILSDQYEKVTLVSNGINLYYVL